MRLSTLAIALAALAGSASAQPIVVSNAGGDAVRAAPPSDCVNASANSGADIECVLNLTPPRPGDEPTPPRRILIRTQWAAPCSTRDAQVVDIGARQAPLPALPVVDQAGAGRSCRR